MPFEQDFLGPRSLNEGKLRAFGFAERGSLLCYAFLIQGGEFRCELTYEDSSLRARIYDAETGDEYIPFRKEGPVGEFVASLREEVGAVLSKIASSCAEEGLFLSKQANRIAALVKERLGVSAEQVFSDIPHSGVFRVPENKKWFGLILNLGEGKLYPGSKAMDIINLKADPSLPRIPPVYPAYHMSKSLWITVPLDGSADDEIVYSYIKKSFDLVLLKHQVKKY